MLAQNHELFETDVRMVTLENQARAANRTAKTGKLDQGERQENRDPVRGPGRRG